MQQFSEMITVRFMERDSKHSIAWGKTEQESKHNIKVVDEICIYYKVNRKLNKLATVGCNNVQTPAILKEEKQEQNMHSFTFGTQKQNRTCYHNMRIMELVA